MKLKEATSTFTVTKDDAQTALIKSAGCFRVLMSDSNTRLSLKFNRDVAVQVFTCLPSRVFSSSPCQCRKNEVKNFTFLCT